MKEKSFISLNLNQLMAKSFDLKREKGVGVRGGGDPSSFEVEQTSEGVTIGGKVAILDSTLAPSQDFNELIKSADERKWYLSRCC